MSSFAALIGMVCACAVAVSLLNIISPNGMTEKTLNLVIGVFIICVMIVPVKNFCTEFKLNISSVELPESLSSDAQKAYNNAVIAQTKTRLEKSLTAALSLDGFSPESVAVNLGENNDGGIYIKGINIYINKSEKHIPEIIRRTQEEFSVTPRVIVRQ